MQFQSPDIKDAEIARHSFDAQWIAHFRRIYKKRVSCKEQSSDINMMYYYYKYDASAYCSEDQMQFTTAIFVPGAHYEVHLIAVTHEHIVTCHIVTLLHMSTVCT